METSEVGTDDKEHPEWLLGVLDLGQERWVQSERQRDLYNSVSNHHTSVDMTTYW